VRGAYLVTVSEDNGSNQVTAGAVSSYSPEFNIVGTDETVLSRISEMTGGHSIADGESAWLFTERPTKTIPHAIWQTLMLTALILLPIDIGIRRVLIDREQVAQMRKRIRSVVNRTLSRRSESVASASIAKLKDARSRVVLSSVERTTAVISKPESARTATMDVSPEPQSSSEPLVSKLLDAKRKRRE
jgi:hypothetical protein